MKEHKRQLADYWGTEEFGEEIDDNGMTKEEAEEKELDFQENTVGKGKDNL